MKVQSRECPTRDDILGLLVDEMYGTRILNNSHRGDLVEMMVLAALQPKWEFVGLGWHPWDLQRGSGEDRVRIQVKQCAAMQLWGSTKKPTISFGWSKNAPSYFERDNPGESIESSGWFCEMFVVGIHDGDDEESIDQVDPSEWEFLVIPTSDLRRGTGSMLLAKALKKWTPVEWTSLREAVDAVASGSTD